MAKIFVFKASLPGKSVYSTEPRDFSFNSQFGHVKIIAEPPSKTYQTVSVNDSATANITIPHNLGFTPLCMIFVELNSGSGRWYNGVSIAGSEDRSAQIFVNDVTSGTYADDTNLYISINNFSGGTKVVKYYYFIFGDDGE